MNNCKHDKNCYLYKGDYHIGLYCGECNKWIKWVNKKDVPRLIASGVKFVSIIK